MRFTVRNNDVSHDCTKLLVFRVYAHARWLSVSLHVTRSNTVVQSFDNEKHCIIHNTVRALTPSANTVQSLLYNPTLFVCISWIQHVSDQSHKLNSTTHLRRTRTITNSKFWPPPPRPAIRACDRFRSIMKWLHVCLTNKSLVNVAPFCIRLEFTVS